MRLARFWWTRGSFQPGPRSVGSTEAVGWYHPRPSTVIPAPGSEEESSCSKVDDHSKLAASRMLTLPAVRRWDCGAPERVGRSWCRVF